MLNFVQQYQLAEDQTYRQRVSIAVTRTVYAVIGNAESTEAEKAAAKALLATPDPFVDLAAYGSVVSDAVTEAGGNVSDAQLLEIVAGLFTVYAAMA